MTFRLSVEVAGGREYHAMISVAPGWAARLELADQLVGFTHEPLLSGSGDRDGGAGPGPVMCNAREGGDPDESNLRALPGGGQLGPLGAAVLDRKPRL